jgi:hypothetical protein
MAHNEPDLQTVFLANWPLIQQGYCLSQAQYQIAVSDCQIANRETSLSACK